MNDLPNQAQSARELTELAANMECARRDAVTDPALRKRIVALVVDLIEKAADHPEFQELWYINGHGLTWSIDNDHYLYLHSNKGWMTAEGPEKQGEATYYLSWNFTKRVQGRPWRVRDMDNGGFTGAGDEFDPIFAALDSSGLWESLVAEFKLRRSQADARIEDAISLIRETMTTSLLGEGEESWEP